MANAKLKTKFTTIKTLVAPDGIAAWVYLDTPDDSFGKLQHRITVFFDKDKKEVKDFFKVVVALRKKFFADKGMTAKGKLPKGIKVADEKVAKGAGVEVGTPYIQFTTKPEQNEAGGWIPVPVYSVNGEPIRKAIWGGDLVSVETNITGWENSTGSDIKFFLSAVQLLKQGERSRPDGGSNFGLREDYATTDDDDPEVEDADVSGLTDEDIEVGDDDGDPTAGLV